MKYDAPAGSGAFDSAAGMKRKPRIMDVRLQGVTSTGQRKRRRGESTEQAKRAYSEYWAGVRSGRIIRPNHCERCGAEGKVEAHHRDHRFATDVEHLCLSCHKTANRIAPAGGCVKRGR